MSAALRKRADKLLSDHWSRAKPILPDAYLDARDAVREVNELVFDLLDHYIRTRPEGETGYWQKMERLAAALPPIHKDFLPTFVDHIRFRHDQWVLHHHSEIVEEEAAFCAGFLAHLKSNFNLSGGLMTVAVPLFEENTRQTIARFEYIGCDCPRDAEIVTRDKVSFCQIHMRIYDELEVYNQLGEAYKVAAEKAHNEAEAEWLLNLHGMVLTPDELKARRKLFAQMDADLSKGKPASKSRAAKAIKAECARNPRLPQPYDK